MTTTAASTNNKNGTIRYVKSKPKSGRVSICFASEFYSYERRKKRISPSIEHPVKTLLSTKPWLRVFGPQLIFVAILNEWKREDRIQ